MDMNMHSITQQPMGFSTSQLDPNSQALFNSLTAKHMSSKVLQGKLITAGQELVDGVQGRFVSLKNNMTYTELLSGLVYKNECILSQDPHFQYKSVSFYDQNFNFLKSKTGGVAIITDRRFLMLSCQYDQTFSMTSFDDPKKLPGGYNIEMSCGDATTYLPIPLANFRSVEMEGRSGVAGSISIHGQPPPCKGYFGCFGCLKSWMDLPMNYTEHNEMSITFGALMPPWNLQMFVQLHIGSDVPLQRIRDMLSLFQSVAPNL